MNTHNPLFAWLLLGVCCCTWGFKATAQDISNIPIIDTHIHLYDPLRPEGVPWPPKSDKTLYRPTLPAHFEEVVKNNSITAAVIVEASDWVEDNQWVLDATRDDPQRYIGLVGQLPIGTKSFAPLLKELSKAPRFVGVRLRIAPHDEEWLTEEAIRDLELLAEMDQSLDVLMANYSLQDVDAIAQQVPSLRILMNHAAGADINGKALAADWIQELNKVAQHANVHCKVSGLFQQSQRSPAPKDLAFYRPTLDALWNAFGEDRLIYGSNWPVSNKGGDYGSYKAIVMEYFAPKGRSVLEKLLYKNAQQFYGLPDLRRDE